MMFAIQTRHHNLPRVLYGTRLPRQSMSSLRTGPGHHRCARLG
jgi:hypothetical protein